GRRRAVAAAGLAVVAVTGGAFHLFSGPGPGDGAADPDEVTQASAPDTATLPATTTPSVEPTQTTTPSATPSPTASHRPKPSPTRTAPKPAPPRPRPPRPTTAAPTTPAPTSSTESGQVIDLVNAERAKAGCGPVTENALLTRAAQGHSDDMAARDFFDHTNPDGDGPGERVTAAGYRWSTYGENIAKGQRTPAEVMDSWMNSPGHRANILNCSFREIGIGIHSAGGPYWTQVFGAQ
ncbi:CAP domain-containing protein, partial [Streptomyces sp. NPDC004788]